jgi:aryl-alcohol dehydrogenase-like predicted oxidoreductase
MSIGDVNSNARGSGARFNDGKADFSLIPLCTLEDEARVWAYGARKYAAWNWAKGMDWSVPFACLQRHLAAWQRGEENDPESGLPHLAHAACNLRMLTLYAQTFPEGDNRPKQWLARGAAPADDFHLPDYGD